MYIPSYGEDVVIVKTFETRKGEWEVRDVATIPEVLFKEYNNYVGTVDSDIHDEQVEVDFYWNKILLEFDLI